MIRIYGTKMSRAVRCLWLLEELGLPYELIDLPVDGEKNRSEEYLALNPAGKIPTLVDGERVLTESMAINFYLAAKHPGALWPADTATQAAVWKWTLWAVSEAEFYITQIVREKRRPADEVDDGRIADSLAQLATTLPVLEQHLGHGQEHILGKEFTLADLNTASVIVFTPMVGMSLDDFPLTAAWLQRCLSRPAWQAVQS